MPSPPPSLLLAIAERIDFDPRVRAAVEADPLVVLTAMGLDAAAAMALAAGSVAGPADGSAEGEVTAFAIAPSPIAVRAHRWAMALLREGGGSIPYRSRIGGPPALAWPAGRADVDGVQPAPHPPGAPR